MKIDLKDFRVPEDKSIRLDKWPTDIKPFYDSEKEYKELLQADVHQLCSLQRLLYAANTYAVLLVFQGMDSAGKDGAISHVLTGINPQGCEVYSFKRPSATELQHDFLWRTIACLPARGRIGVFNRSCYEDVLIVRVHPGLLHVAGISDKDTSKKSFWEGRYRSIVDLEKHLHRNQTIVIKFYLHLSKDEQRRRLLARIDDPDKNWKFNPDDLVERKYWDQYMEAYSDCLSTTSTDTAPWYIIPADDKLNARLIISHVVIEALAALNMNYPKMSNEQIATLQTFRAQLVEG